jgi:hypothetical protein
MPTDGTPSIIGPTATSARPRDRNASTSPGESPTSTTIRPSARRCSASDPSISARLGALRAEPDDDRVVAGLGAHRLDPGDDVREVPAVEHRDGDRHRLRAPGREARGGRVGAVVELDRDLLDPHPRRLGDVRQAPQRPADRGDGHPGCERDVFDRGPVPTGRGRRGVGHVAARPAGRVVERGDVPCKRFHHRPVKVAMGAAAGPSIGSPQDRYDAEHGARTPRIGGWHGHRTCTAGDLARRSDEPPTTAMWPRSTRCAIAPSSRHRGGVRLARLRRPGRAPTRRVRSRSRRSSTSRPVTSDRSRPACSPSGRWPTAPTRSTSCSRTAGSPAATVAGPTRPVDRAVGDRRACRDEGDPRDRRARRAG